MIDCKGRVARDLEREGEKAVFHSFIQSPGASLVGADAVRSALSGTLVGSCIGSGTAEAQTAGAYLGCCRLRLWLNWLHLNTRPFGSPYVVVRSPCTVSPGMLSGGWSGSRAARIQTSSHVGCWHGRLLHHSASPRCLYIL